MIYDSINGNTEGENDALDFYTIGRLIDLATEFDKLRFVFFDSHCTVGELHSWRGSFETPAISYEYVAAKTGKQIAKELKQALKKEHCGHKGGTYKFTEDMQFYVSEKGNNEYFKVLDYRFEDNQVVLLTKLDK